MLTLFSLPALYFALRCTCCEKKDHPIKAKLFIHWPSTLNSITLLAAILIDGIVVVVLGILFLSHHERHIYVQCNDVSLRFILVIEGYALSPCLQRVVGLPTRLDWIACSVSL